MSYLALDRDLLTSSLWATGTPEQIKVWIYLLLQADPRSGIVEDAAPAIALRCGLPLTEVQAALDWLASPDPYSRTKDHDGRRIEIGEDGILILNYVARSKKDHSTERVRRWREVKRKETVSSLQGTPGNEEQEQEQEQEQTETTPAAPPAPRTRAGKDTWLTPYLAAWLERTGGDLPPKRAAKALGALHTKRKDAEALPRWRIYLAATAPAYASPERFAATYGTWAHPPVQRAGNWDTPDVSERAREYAREPDPDPGEVKAALARTVERFNAELPEGRPALKIAGMPA